MRIGAFPKLTRSRQCAYSAAVSTVGSPYSGRVSGPGPERRNGGKRSGSRGAKRATQKAGGLPTPGLLSDQTVVAE
jgi:hypothetical protein